MVGGYELPDDLVAAGVQPGAFRDPLLTTEMMPAGGIGGPILQNRMFFYASARHSRETKWDRVNKVGTPLPDEVRTGPEFFGKLNFAPGQQHQLTGSYRHRPNHVENAGTGADFAPTRGLTDRQRQRGRHGRVVELHRQQSVRERALPRHEGEERGHADYGSWIPAHVRSTQPLGDGPIQRSLAGEPDRGRGGVRERSELQAARSARDLHPVFRRQEDQPRAEGRHRLRIRGGAFQPHAPMGGG